MTPQSAMLFLRRYAYAAAQSAWLLTGGICTVEGRKRFRTICGAYGFAERKPLLPVVPLEQIVGDDAIVKVRSPRGSRWNVQPFELCAIAAIVQKFKPKSLFEIGTFDGRTTLNLHTNAVDDATIHTLDLPPNTQELHGGAQAGERFANKVPEDRIKQLYGNSMTYDFQPFAGQVDFVFVDAGHDHENVAKDSESALLMTEGRPNAVILWHDYRTFGGVTQAVDELRDKVADASTIARIDDTSIAIMIRNAS